MKTYQTIIAAVVAGLACSAVTSQATLTDYGSVLETSPLSVPPADILASLSNPYVSGANPGFNGTFNSWAIAAGDDSVATALGFTGITFVFQANATGGSIGSISVNGFSGVLGFGYLSGATDPINAGDLGGGTIKVNWSDPPGYSGTGDYLYIYTDQTTLASIADSVQDGSSATPVGLSPVPEPATVAAGVLMLLPLGIGAVRSLRKERTA